ncbi:MAG: beta-ketoacyl-[acyl-carrier-protein] synthase family protein [Pseudomonadota bacterium]
MHRVAITGLGVISALGIGKQAHFKGLAEGVNGIRTLEMRDVDRLMIKIGAQASFDENAYFGRQEIALFDRVTQFALIAAAEAFEQSGLEITEELGLQSATIIATAMGGLNTQDDNYRTVYQEQKNRVHPFIIPRLMANAPVSQVSMKFGLKGPAYSVATACASSNHAIGQAFNLIRSGQCKAAVTGGTESVLCFGGVKAWEGLRVMSKDGCRPFAKTRNGMVLGEGCAILILEEWEAAKSRGAPILAELCGSGVTADATDIVAPDVSGASRAMTLALKDARMAPEEVTYINAHGTATAINDRTEAAAIRQALNAQADRVMVSSTKSMHGHAIGAAGALEAAAVLMSIGQGVVPPTINYDEPDPEITLDVVPNEARDAKVDAALSNAFAFGGLNAVLAFRRAA